MFKNLNLYKPKLHYKSFVLFFFGCKIRLTPSCLLYSIIASTSLKKTKTSHLLKKIYATSYIKLWAFNFPTKVKLLEYFGTLTAINFPKTEQLYCSEGVTFSFLRDQTWNFQKNCFIFMHFKTISFTFLIQQTEGKWYIMVVKLSFYSWWQF